MSALSLAQTFLSHLPPPLPPDWAATPTLEDGLRRLFEAGCAAYPAVALPAPRFVEHLASHVRPDDLARGPSRYGEGLAAADLYLACACLQGDAAALDHFERACIAHVPALLSHMNQPEDFVAELQQRLREALLVATAAAPPRLAQYSGRGSLRGWFSSVAIRRALNDLRARGRASPLRDDDQTAGTLLSQDDPELALLKARYGTALRSAIVDAFQTLSPQQRNVLSLHYGGQLTTLQIGAMFQVSHSTIVRWLTAARAAVQTETRRLLCERLRLSPAEVGSIVRLTMSQLDLSLSTLIQPRA